MSKLLGGYIFKHSEFNTKKDILEFIKRTNNLITALSTNSDKIREHTRFHILDNISYALIHLQTEIEYSELKVFGEIQKLLTDGYTYVCFARNSNPLIKTLGDDNR